MGRSQDGGWAWVVLLGAHVGTMLSNGYLLTLGVFYTEWKEVFELSATNASWLVSMPMLVASPLCVGAVMTVSPSMIMISHYFKRRYVLANGLAVLGLNVGQMVFPPLIRLLVVSYGWRGAMFIIGALQLHGVAACALFRPLKASLSKTPQHEDIGTSNKERTNSANAFLEYLRCFQIFANVKAMLVLISNSLHSMAIMVNLIHLPERSREAGWSRDQSAMLVFVYGLVSVVTRSTHGWFVDRNHIGSFKLQLLVILGATVTSSLNPVSDSYVFLVGYTVVLGAFLGASTPLLIVNMKNVASASQVPAALSLVWASIYLFNGIGSVVAGKIYDATGNYVAPFLTSGAMFLSAFLVFAIVTFMKRREDRTQDKNKMNTSGALRYHTAADGLEENSL
ncbi:monocarboxylate transporter 13-like isoform X2 [Patiria miniata]|uniref:Monocarboxylate transporter n=1 Tax=Patiria miniata TaxID=46514 RepID=A0A914A7L7_PATMI|nr:monocarboxylate transporter 13-like isoform X2 [Patiria miniata]